MMMFINKYEANDNGCKLCTEYFEKSGCAARSCPYISKRIESGLIDYRGAIYETFSKQYSFDDRLLNLANSYSGMLWSNIQHERRMDKLRANLSCHRRKNSFAYYSAMYLLTANEDINRRTNQCFTKCGIILKNAKLSDISIHNRLLYSVAEIVCQKTDIVSILDLTKQKYVDNEAFRLIINAVLINRYGLNAFLLTK